jgi:hypothetical protein
VVELGGLAGGLRHGLDPDVQETGLGRRNETLTDRGVDFGTNSESAHQSRDKKETRDEVTKHLPTVLSVEFMG